MRLASVVLDIPTQAFDSPYTYVVRDPGDASEGIEIPGGLDPLPTGLEVCVGSAVAVPFGGRPAIGYVVGMREADGQEGAPGLGRTKLKTIVRAVSEPCFDEEAAACALWMAHRYVAPLSACVRLFTPPGGVPRLVRSRNGRGPAWRLERPAVGKVDDRWVVAGEAADGFIPRKNAVKQQAILEAVAAGDVRMAELATELGPVSAAVAALERRGVVRVERRRRMRPCPPPPVSAPLSRPPLTSGQEEAVRAIEKARRDGPGRVVLVDGVTGSGKTEVYLRAIERVLSDGRNACVLVPEIALTPQTVARFRGRFGDTVAVMHSRMGTGERLDQWDLIRSGCARVVVGARSALFTPLPNVGIYVIDEEHEGTYKQENAPRYHARVVACWMAARSGAVVVLGSATPSIDSLHACATDASWVRVELPSRVNGRPLPPIEVIDMAAEFGGGSRSMFSARLARALATELSRGNKAVLLLNQRGFAKFLLCRECGFVPECPHCSTSLTYHEQGNKLVCHHCGHTRPAPSRCPECGSPYLRKFGAGTQRVEAELRALLDGMEGVGPGVPVVRMDADTTARKGAHQSLLEQFAAADAAVLLGTQMIAKGLDFDSVTLVGVVNADTQLHLPDYRAAERTFALVEQVAGRAGRAELPGRVMVQTYEADNEAIRAAASYDRPRFLRAELARRRALSYPPYVRLVNVLVWGGVATEVEQSALALHGELVRRVADHCGEGWQVLPAGPCLLSRLRGSYRWHILLKCPPSCDAAAVVEPLFRARKAKRGVNVAVDVDPADLF